jgi:hypothetical protein
MTMYLPMRLPWIVTLVTALGTGVFTGPVFSSEGGAGEEFVPSPGVFAPASAGKPFIGELISVDPVNRRGALRLLGDGVDDRYHSAPPHRFALLPYGTVRYHGAPAELRDVPIGTVLHGDFVLPPEGDTTIPKAPKGLEKYVPKENHALRLEDGMSFFLRHQRHWKITTVDTAKQQLRALPEGPTVPGFVPREELIDFDGSTRFWKGRQPVGAEQMKVGSAVQMNFTWSPDWRYGRVHCLDMWLDEESVSNAKEMQRQTHLRYTLHRWLPGWVDSVEHLPGGRGTVTVTLFSGMDPSLYERAKAQSRPGGGASLAAAEYTLRGYWQDHDSKNGPIVEWKELPDPPPGSSGIQVKIRIQELLEGFRPTRVVRFRPNGFPNVKLPPEERLNWVLE